MIVNAETVSMFWQNTLMAYDIPWKLKILRERAGLSMLSIANAMGYKTASGYQRYENPDDFKKQHLPVDFASKFADAVVGRGNPPISRAEVMALAGLEPGSTDNIDADDFVSIQQFSETALSAGPGAEGSGRLVTGSVAYRRSWIRKLTSTDPKRLVILPVRGDSMYPTLDDDDIVMIDTGDTEIISGKIYALRSLEGLLVKRLRKDPILGSIEIVSDNPSVGSFAYTREQIEVIGRVIWLGRRV